MRGYIVPKNADGPTTFHMEFGYQGSVRAHHPYVSPPTPAEMNERQKARTTERAVQQRELDQLVANHPDLRRRASELVALGKPASEVIRHLRDEASERQRRFGAVREARR